MNLRKLTDDQLHHMSIAAAKREREETLCVLNHLAETERRRLYSKFECDSLHAYCTKYLKMSEGQAGRHVSASRLITELPVIQEKVQSGSMSFTTVCQASSFFKKEAAAGRRFDESAKLELLSEIEDQSSRRVEQILLSRSAHPEVHFRESVKQKTEQLTEIKIVVDEATFAQLERLKQIWSHEMLGATYAQLLRKMATLSLMKCDPNEKAKRAAKRAAEKPTDVESLTPAPESEKTRAIPAAVRHEVRRRDGGRCTFVDHVSGKNCGATHFIEMDHVHPFALGGAHTVENLRLRCRAHNQRHATDIFGEVVIERCREQNRHGTNQRYCN